jgi:hypothetical protein
MFIDHLPSSSSLPLPISKQPINNHCQGREPWGFVQLKELFQYLRGITQIPTHLLRCVGREEEHKIILDSHHIN